MLPDLTTPVIRVPTELDTAEFRRRIAQEPWCGEGPVRLFTCARLTPSKIYGHLIEALVDLAGRGIDAGLRCA